MMTNVAEHKVRLTFEGGNPLDISCREDEDVISAGLRQGILLVSDCREGICGACRAFLEDGRYDDLLEHSPHALSEQDEAGGWVLACRLRPSSDLHLDFDYPVDRVAKLDVGRRSGRIVALERLSAAVSRIVVRTLAAQEPLHWEPGQHVRVHLPDAGIARAYSIANVSGNSHDLEFFIRLIPGGAFSGALESMRGAGAPVVVEGPFGSFTLEPVPQASVFVAGGTGLAPILSMLRKLTAGALEQPATLIFGVSTEENLFAHAEIEALVAASPGLSARIAVADPTPSWTGARGTAADVLAETLAHSADPRRCRYYVAGPPAMVEAVCAVMARFDVPGNAIHKEALVESGDPS